MKRFIFAMMIVLAAAPGGSPTALAQSGGNGAAPGSVSSQAPLTVDSAKKALQTAQIAAAGALSALNTARANVEARLKSDATYQDLTAKVQAAQEEVDNARTGGSPDELQHAATDKMSASTALKDYVGGFTAADPAVVKAQKQLDIADAAVSVARRRLDLAEKLQPPATPQPTAAEIQRATQTSYDDVKNETTVSLAAPLVAENLTGGSAYFKLSAHYTFAGQTQTSTPDGYDLIFSFYSRDWVFSNAGQSAALALSVALDGKRRLSIPLDTYDSKIDPDVAYHCVEPLGYRLKFSQLKAIGAASKVEGEIFNVRFSFTPQQISGLRALAATVKIVPPTTAPSGDDQAPFDTPAEWQGSGFFVSSDGLILTNRHVAADEENPDAKTNLNVYVAGSDKPLAAQVVQIDKDEDLALIKVTSPSPTPAVRFGTGDFPNPGAECNILGFPMADDLGNSLKITHGSVTAVHQSGANDPWAIDGRDLMLDAKANPGNSGGPVVNQFGDLLGVLDAKTANERFEDSYAISISIGRIRDFMRRCNVAVPEAAPDDKSMSPEDIFKLVSPSVVRIEGQLAQ